MEPTQDISNTPQVLQIPQNIQDDIREQWFHLYRWISPDEVKLSIERDFLKTLKIIGIPLAIISIIIAIFSGGDVIVFFVILGIGVMMMFAYLLFLSLQRSFLLSRSAFIILTDTAISLWGKIRQLSEISVKDSDIEKMEATFEEEIFWESHLSNSKKSLWGDVLEQLFWGYKYLLEWSDRVRMLGGSRDSAQWVLVILAFYTLYALVMSMVYFIWVFFLLVFWWIMVWINTKYLRLRGNTVMRINGLFWKLNQDSEALSDRSHSLKKLLSQAQENDWKDGLLLKIQSEIEHLSKIANQAVDDVVELTRVIENSRYKDMFQTQTYHKWIQKKIQTPLHSLQKLLEKNLNSLKDSQKDVDTQIANKPEPTSLQNLKLQKKRLAVQQEEIERFGEELKTMQEKIS